MEIARRSVRGSLILIVSYFCWAVAGLASLIVIARLLGPAQYGLYSIAAVFPSILQFFIGLGVNFAVIRYTAYSVSAGRPQEAKRFTLNAIYFLWLTGAFLTFLDYVLAGPASSYLLHRPDLTPYVQLMSLGVIGSALLTTAMAAAQGWSWMSLSGFSQIVQSVLKLGLSPFLIIAGFGVAGALTGNNVSYIAAGIIGTVILYLRRLRGLPERGYFAADVKKMLKFGMPLYVGVLAVNLAGSYVTIVLAAIATNTVFGLYQAAFNIVLPISLVSTSLVGALFPAFASVDGIGGDAKTAFRGAYKFVAFLLAPITIFIVSASPYLVHVFYGASYNSGVPYLRLLALAYIPIAFGYTVHPAFFSGFGRPRLAFLVYASGALTLVFFAFLFSVQLDFGVYGLIYATFLSYLVAWLVGTVMAARSMGATLDLRANAAIVAISIVSYVATTQVPLIGSSNSLSLLVDILVFFSLYLTLAPLAGAVNGGDLDLMEHTFEGLGLVSSIFDLLVRYERAILSLRERQPM